MTERYQQNLASFAKMSPEIAVRLQFFEPSSASIEESSEWIVSQIPANADLLFVYGVGEGKSYPCLRAWLREDSRRYAVYVEDDLSALYHLMNRELTAELLADRQVQIQFFSDQPSLDALAWFAIHLRRAIVAQPNYRSRLPRLKQQLFHEIAKREETISEYLNFGFRFYDNFYRNLLSLPTAKQGSALFGRFQGIPAIVCGAGPSLDSVVPQLANLTDRALLLAGGSAVGALAHAGVLPHFGGAIDPNPLQAERVLRSSAFEIPYFYRNRLNHYALQAIHGQRVFIQGAGGYQVAAWLEEKLGIAPSAEIEEGHNVATFLMDIARHLGCSPIILVGMDLAYTDDRSYASGVPDTPFVRGEVSATDIGGKPIQTEWKWLTESEWISQFAREYPVINATGAGIGMVGVQNRALSDLDFPEPTDLYGYVHAALQASPHLPVRVDSVRNALQELMEGLVECQQLAADLDQEFALTEASILRGEKVPDGLQSGLAAFYDVELQEHPVFKSVLAPLCAGKARALQRRSLLAEGDALATLAIYREKTRFAILAAQNNRELLQKILT